MNPDFNLKAAIANKARELGFDACRVTTAAAPDHRQEFEAWIAGSRHGEMGWIARNAHKRVDPEQVLPGARSIITLAVSYAGENDTGSREPGRDPSVDVHGFRSKGQSLLTSAATVRGVVARYAQFADYHDVMAGRLKALSQFVDEAGGPGVRSLWYMDTGPLLERDLAQRAGLGFAGKHTNLISRELGNWFFLAEIITTLELPADEPERNRCGSCTRCLAACPTQAITAPFQLDARRCISYLTIELKGSIPVELRKAIGTRIYGCDDCLAVCPWNRFAATGRIMKEHARADLHLPDLVELLSLDDAGFKRRFAGTPMVRTKRRGILRNVCVALGNIGDPGALPALEQAARDVEPLIAEHARWAIEQIEEAGREAATSSGVI